MAAFVHIVPDDKFIDDAIAFFSDLGGNHRWLSFSNETKTAFCFIKSDKVESVTYADVIGVLKEGCFDVVVFHTMYVPHYKLVLQVPEDKVVIWNAWGADIYYRDVSYPPIVKLDLYKRLTRKYLIVERIPFGKKIKSAIKDIIWPSRIKNRRDHLKRAREEEEKSVSLQRDALSRIDACSTVLQPEYEELKKLDCFKAVYFPFKYVSKEKNPNSIQLHFEGDCILVGNSADPSNNHLDVLRYLDKKGVTNKRIIPLSYGKTKTIDVLREKYGGNDNIELMTRFLDRTTYWNKVRSCKVAVFGHIRQQALGNINQCLLQGSKVFLYKDSMVYKYYRSQGVSVFSIEDDLDQNSVDEELTLQVIDQNRRIVLDIWDYDKVLCQVRDSISLLLNASKNSTEHSV